MYETFRGVKDLLRRKPKIVKPRADNIVFRLHYQFTFGFLAVAVLLVTGYHYIDSAGSAIQCMMPGSRIDGGLINRYCWIMSTYTLPKHYEGEAGKDIIALGVGPHDKNGLDPFEDYQPEDEEEKVHHAYYQWVPLFLSFQAAMFYLPHYIWKMLEGGRFRQILNGLNVYENPSEKEKEVNELFEYFRLRLSDAKHEHKEWALKLYFCELLNFINVVFQIKMTDVFLGGAFSRYGLEAASWSEEDPEGRVDPMYIVFPRITKCMFHKYGVSGTIERHDALCVLGMNIINEKIFVFLWFWYVFLATLSALNLIMRMLELFMPRMRLRLVKLEEFGMREKKIEPETLESVLDHLTYSDWLLLYYLAQSMDKSAFACLVRKLSKFLNKQEPLMNHKNENSDIDSLKDIDDERMEMGRSNNSTLRSPAKLSNFVKKYIQ